MAEGRIMTNSKYLDRLTNGSRKLDIRINQIQGLMADFGVNQEESSHMTLQQLEDYMRLRIGREIMYRVQLAIEEDL